MHVADQADAAQDEGAHDDLADVRLAGDEAVEVRALHPHDARILAGAAAHQDGAVVEEVELAGELPRVVRGEDMRLPVLVQVENLYRAVEHEEEVDAALAAGEEDRAGGSALFRAVAATRAAMSGERCGKVCSSRCIGSLGSIAGSSAAGWLTCVSAMVTSFAPAGRPAAQAEIARP